jgi:hypothetical protein
MRGCSVITLCTVGSLGCVRSVPESDRGLTRPVSPRSFRNLTAFAVQSACVCMALLVYLSAPQARLAYAEPSLKPNGTGTSGNPTTLSGSWSASAMKEAWSFPAWPEACGPKPASLGASGGTSEVLEQGGELVFSGAGKPYKTSSCWDQSEGIRRVTHAQNARSWTNTCKTLTSDARQVNLQTAIAATDSRITFRETGHYVYRQGGATCEADVTRTRSYTRLDAKAKVGETRAQSSAALLTPALAAPPDETTSSNEQAPNRPPSNECQNPGQPSEIRFGDVAQWVEPGGHAQFSAQAFDKAGCPARGTVVYSVEPANANAAINERTGLLRLAGTAEQGTLTIVARSGEASKAVTLPVVSKESRSALLQTPGDEPVRANAGNHPVADSIIGSTATQAQNGATERKWWFAGLAGLIVVGLATLGLRLLRAGSRSTSESPPARTPSLSPAVRTGTVDDSIPSRKGRIPGGSSITTGEIVLKDLGKTDPGRGRRTSREVFTHSAASEIDPPPSTQSNRNPAPIGIRESSCPKCGTRYVDGSLYCGVDGERLR